MSSSRENSNIDKIIKKSLRRSEHVASSMMFSGHDDVCGAARLADQSEDDHVLTERPKSTKERERQNFVGLLVNDITVCSRLR